MNNQLDYSTDFLIRKWSLIYWTTQRMHWGECLDVLFHCSWLSWHLYSYLFQKLKCHCSHFYFNSRAKEILYRSLFAAHVSCACVFCSICSWSTWHIFFGFFAGSITPTVELNGLAMKRGEPAIYRPLDPKPVPNYRANYNFRGMYNQRFVLSSWFDFFNPLLINVL